MIVFDIDDTSTISNVFYVRMLLYIYLYLILYILIPPLKHRMYPSSILGCFFFSVAWRSRQVNLVAPRFPIQRWIVASETWWVSNFKIHLQTYPQTQITTYLSNQILSYLGFGIHGGGDMLCSLGWACWGLHRFLFHCEKIIGTIHPRLVTPNEGVHGSGKPPPNRPES